MQSGISASRELQDAFNQLVSSPDQRALLAGIKDEAIVPLTTIPAKNDNFTDDLQHLQSHLTPTQAAYVLLKLTPTASNGYAAISYVPNAAPVRQKMLFASTRLTLVRELGIERFGTTLFATEAEELTAAGWAKHEAHVAAAAPLSAEEDGLRSVKEAEAMEATGTSTRRGHVADRVDVVTGAGVLEALGTLREPGCRGTLVQLRYDLPDETLQLESSTDNVRPGEVAKLISATDPRYAFYSHPGTDANATEAKILFLYTCPSGSKIRERMIYSTGKSWLRNLAERDANVVITRSLEATEPEELSEDVLNEAVGANTAAAANSGVESESSRTGTPINGGFARPKRPGRR